MSYSRESASDKLSRGQSLLSSGLNDPAILGTALIALHGALEDRLRDLLASRLPAESEKILDSRAVQWKDLLVYAEKHLGLSKLDSDFITQANNYRATFAHSGNFRWTRLGMQKYEELIRQVWATGSRPPAGAAAGKPSTSPKTAPRYSTAPMPYRGLPGIVIEDRPWYRSTGWYWVFFVLALPVWIVLIFTDKQAGILLKSAAAAALLVSLTVAVTLLNHYQVVPLLAVTGGVSAEATATLAPTTEAPKETPRAAQPTQALSPTATAAAAGGTPGACQLAWEDYTGSDLINKNRAMVWSEIVSQRVKGSAMKPEEFIAQVVEYNPALKTDGYVFLRGKVYQLPVCK